MQVRRSHWQCPIGSWETCFSFGIISSFSLFFSSTLKIQNIMLWVFNYEIETCLKDNGADLPNSEVAGGFWAAPGAFYNILQCAPFSKPAKSPSLLGVTAFPFPISLRYIFCSFSLSLTSPTAQCLRPRDCCPPPLGTNKPQDSLGGSYLQC